MTRCPAVICMPQLTAPTSLVPHRCALADGHPDRHASEDWASLLTWSDLSIDPDHRAVNDMLTRQNRTIDGLLDRLGEVSI